MYHKKDSHTEAFLEGGDFSENELDLVDLSIPDVNREEFIRKVFGLFGFQVLLQSMIVGVIAQTNTPQNCAVKVPNGLVTMDANCLEKDWVY